MSERALKSLRDHAPSKLPPQPYILGDQAGGDDLEAIEPNGNIRDRMEA
jgi:hypothetical protein